MISSRNVTIPVRIQATKTQFHYLASNYLAAITNSRNSGLAQTINQKVIFANCCKMQIQLRKLKLTLFNIYSISKFFLLICFVNVQYRFKYKTVIKLLRCQTHQNQQFQNCDKNVSPLLWWQEKQLMELFF